MMTGMTRGLGLCRDMRILLPRSVLGAFRVTILPQNNSIIALNVYSHHRYYSAKTQKVLDTQEEKPIASTPEKKSKLTQAEADAALIAAYREKFGGETTATFEDGKPSEMGRAVRNNMFRCKQGPRHLFMLMQ